MARAQRAEARRALLPLYVPARGACDGALTPFADSGHGSQVKDRDGDEVDGFDEVILPVDFRKAGIITDDVSLIRLVCVLVDY